MGSHHLEGEMLYDRFSGHFAPVGGKGARCLEMIGAKALPVWCELCKVFIK